MWVSVVQYGKIFRNQYEILNKKTTKQCFGKQTESSGSIIHLLGKPSQRYLNYLCSNIISPQTDCNILAIERDNYI